ncbi:MULTISPECIES: hypothetical protein [unclassified Kitasatospora]|uniref:hypothetical protein n=1 Tax=unclassified Kitasatospora TaxID=2633591 RepID=UPI002E35B8D2|nr:hypothetical protein [Kitasatospora sp. NBC_01246]
MSVNIELALFVDGLTGREQAWEVVHALAAVLRDERIDDEVRIGVGELDGEFIVSGESEYPLVITRFYAWRPAFERAVTEAVGKVAPHARPAVEWGYPDER